MDMKWFYGIIAFITFVTITSAAKNNIPRLYNNHQRHRNQLSSSSSSNYNNNYYNVNRDDGSYGGTSSSSSSWHYRQHQQQFPWKSHYFFRQIKNQQRTCGKFLKNRVSEVCGGCPPDGLTSIRKRSGLQPKIVEACCINQCENDTIKTIACNECNI